MHEEVNLALADLLDHGLILLFGHASEVARQGEVDSLQLGKGIHQLCRANPGMQYQSIWEGRVLLQDLLQPAKGTHTMHLYDTKSDVVACHIKVQACKADLLLCIVVWLAVSLATVGKCVQKSSTHRYRSL